MATLLMFDVPKISRNSGISAELGVEMLSPQRWFEVYETVSRIAQMQPDDAAARKQIHARVLDAVRDLPASYRIVLVMRDMEHLSTQETATALGLEESAVKMRLHRARLMVRKSLEKAFAARSGAGGAA